MTSDDDEFSEFRRAMSDIKPLHHDRVQLEREKPPPIARFTRQDQKLVLNESLNDTSMLLETGDEVQFCRAGIKHPIMRKLRAGKYSVLEEIDLHGLNVASAKMALSEFIKEALIMRWNCVRVIHGKGNRSFQGIAVLRPKVINWLRRTDTVVAFCSATSRDGGTGALYVLLANADTKTSGQ